MADIADMTIITTDNPRSEEPALIAEQVASGIGDEGLYEIILDRRRAIASALDRAGAGDTVLIAGKGPEAYMEIKGEKIPFLDLSVLMEWTAQKGLKVVD